MDYLVVFPDGEIRTVGTLAEARLVAELAPADRAPRIWLRDPSLAGGARLVEPPGPDAGG